MGFWSDLVKELVQEVIKLSEEKEEKRNKEETEEFEAKMIEMEEKGYGYNPVYNAWGKTPPHPNSIRLFDKNNIEISPDLRVGSKMVECDVCYELCESKNMIYSKGVYVCYNCYSLR